MPRILDTTVYVVYIYSSWLSRPSSSVLVLGQKGHPHAERQIREGEGVAGGLKLRGTGQSASAAGGVVSGLG